jgi:Xaa-Pro aminopeptidase
MSTEQLKEIFSYHAPTAEQREIYEKINAAFLACAETIDPLLPEGPGKTVAIRKLAEARMQANASVALEGKF